MSNSSIWPVDRNLSGAITPGILISEKIWNYLTMNMFTCTRDIIDIAMILNFYRVSREQWQWSSTLHFPMFQHYWSLTIVLFRFINRTHNGESYPFTEMQSEYCTALTEWTTEDSLYCRALAEWTTRDSLGEVWPFLRDVVDVFYYLSCLSHWTLVRGVLPLYLI